MGEQLVPLPFDAAIVNRLRGKSLVNPTGEDVRALCRMLDWCEQRLIDIRLKLDEIVSADGGTDDGIIYLSSESPTHFDPELKCNVYDHEHFSELGDALVALHKRTDVVG